MLSSLDAQPCFMPLEMQRHGDLKVHTQVKEGRDEKSMRIL